MPSLTLSATAPKWSRIVTAMESSFDREDDETDAQYFERWLRSTLGSLVHRYERGQTDPGQPDNIVDVTG